MQINSKSPCYDCPKRRLGCQDHCPSAKEHRKRLDKIRQERNADAVYRDYKRIKMEQVLKKERIKGW